MTNIQDLTKVTDNTITNAHLGFNCLIAKRNILHDVLKISHLITRNCKISKTWRIIQYSAFVIK